MTLVDVRYDDGDQGVIAQGYVTEHMTRIQRARGPDDEGGPRTRRYLQFTGADGRLVSGLDLTSAEAHRVKWAFGAAEERDTSPAALIEDLRVGEKVPIRGAGRARWLLHLRRDDRIEIRGAKLSRDRPHLMRPSLQNAVAYEAMGNFLYLRSHEDLAIFVEHFPVADAPGELEEAA